MGRITKYEPSENSMFPYKLKDDELSTKLDGIHKLGQYEDNDDKIGINYNIITQALLKGVYYIEFGTTQIKHTNGLSLQAFDGKRFCLANKQHCFIMEDYGKSKYNPWALTKEELEK